MSDKHTSEPWKAARSSIAGTVDVYVGDGLNGNIERIADVIGLENARRIVACVNACAGISTENLELFTTKGSLSVLAQNIRLEQQRDELLHALNSAVSHVKYIHDKFQETGSGNGFITQWEALIAKCEAEK